MVARWLSHRNGKRGARIPASRCAEPLSGGETPPALWRHLRHVLMVQHVVGTDRCSNQDLVDIVRDPQYRERSRMVEEERPGRPVRRAQNDRASTPP